MKYEIEKNRILSNWEITGVYSELIAGMIIGLMVSWPFAIFASNAAGNKLRYIVLLIPFTVFLIAWILEGIKFYKWTSYFTKKEARELLSMNGFLQRFAAFAGGGISGIFGACLFVVIFVPMGGDVMGKGLLELLILVPICFTVFSFLYMKLHEKLMMGKYGPALLKIEYSLMGIVLAMYFIALSN